MKAKVLKTLWCFKFYIRPATPLTKKITRHGPRGSRVGTEERMVGQGNWLPPPVALGKVPSYPVEHRLDKSTRTGEPVILSEHQIASGRDVPLAGGHVMVSIQDRSQDRGAIKHQWGGSLRAQSSHGHSFHTEISSQTGVALVSCKGV